MASQGKRMVPEKLIKESGQGGGGATYTAGDGISIDANNEISANIKAGSGIVVDTDLTDDSLVVMVDQADIPYKSDLATVATTGDYDDLTNKPTIPVEVKFTDVVDIGDNDEANITSDQVAEIQNGTKRLKARGWLFELSFDISETDDQLILNPSTTNAITNDSNIINGHYAIITVSTGRVHIYTAQYNNVVSANTGVTPTATLSDISVGSDVYSIPTGTTVVANSTATPSATLTTLQVGTDTYEVPQGGGSSYTFTNGLTESSGTVSWDLNDKIKINYAATSSGLTGPGIKSSDSNTGNNTLIDLGSGGFISRSGDFSNYSSANVLVGNNNKIESNSCYRNIFLGKENRMASSGNSDNILVGYQNSTFGSSKNFNMVLGRGNIAYYSNQIIIGNYSVENTNKAIVVGNGTSTGNRSNLLTVDWDGTIVSKNLPAVDTTTAGTYTLQATVDAQGNVTYSWVTVTP